MMVINLQSFFLSFIFVVAYFDETKKRTEMKKKYMSMKFIAFFTDLFKL